MWLYILLSECMAEERGYAYFSQSVLLRNVEMCTFVYACMAKGCGYAYFCQCVGTAEECGIISTVYS